MAQSWVPQDEQDPGMCRKALAAIRLSCGHSQGSQGYNTPEVETCQLVQYTLSGTKAPKQPAQRVHSGDKPAMCQQTSKKAPVPQVRDTRLPQCREAERGTMRSQNVVWPLDRAAWVFSSWAGTEQVDNGSSCYAVHKENTSK